MSDETKVEVKEIKDEARPEQQKQRVVVFELLTEGYRIIRNDCVSALEFRGLMDSASELYKKK